MPVGVASATTGVQHLTQRDGPVRLRDFLDAAQRETAQGFRANVPASAAFDAAMRESFETGVRSLELPVGRLAGSFSWPPPGIDDPRYGPYRLRGGGRGEPFAVLQRGTTLIGADPSVPTLHFGGTKPGQGSGTMDIGDLRVEGEQIAGVPVLSFDALYASRADAIDVFQNGKGDGVRLNFMVTGSYSGGYALNRDWMQDGGVRTGTGFDIVTDRDFGLGKLSNVTSRGWELAYRFGRDDAGRLFSFVVDRAEASCVTHGMDVSNAMWCTTITSPYFEGTETGIVNRGHSTLILNPWIPYVREGLVDRSDRNAGTVMLGGAISLNPDGATGVAINASGGLKVLLGTNIVHGSAHLAAARGTGLRIEGADPFAVIALNFDPMKKWGGQSRKIDDRSHSRNHPASAGSGLVGIGMYDDGAGQVHLSLDRGAHRLHVDPVELTERDVHERTLTIGWGSIFILRLSAPTIIERIRAPNMPDKTFTLVNRNGNLRLSNSPGLLLRERSGDFVAPEEGSVHHFQVMPAKTELVEELGRLSLGQREGITSEAPLMGNRPGDRWFFRDLGVPGYWSGNAWKRFSDDSVIISPRG